MEILKITNPPTYGVIVEKQLGRSLFHEVYKGAADNVSDIISRNNDDKSSEQNINTTIAFVGSRGTGKSSAMYSFSEFLKKSNEKNACNWLSDEHKTAADAISQTNFHPLPVIDSSQLSDKETVIGRISAEMYKEYENKYKKELFPEQKQDFIRKVKEINALAVKIHTGEWFKADDNLLSNTEKICDMRKKVSDLIQTFLNIAEKSSTNSYLIVSIDDLDMGVKNAYAIMEEIRKYLCIPKVIVLVSIDEALLRDVLSISMATSMGYKAESADKKSLISILAYRYLEKLFPYDRQHYMPTLNANTLKNVKASNFLSGGDSQWKDSCLTDGLNSKPIYSETELPSIMNASLHLIWRKTMLILVCNKFGEHMIIPRNLRSFCNLIVLLRKMDDVAYKKDENGNSVPRYFNDFRSDDNARNILDRNLNRFGDYLVDNYSSYGVIPDMNKAEEQISKTLIALIHLIHKLPSKKINAQIVGDILYCIYNLEDNSFYRDIFNNVINKKIPYSDLLTVTKNYPDAISMGDVMYVLGKLDSKTHCEYIQYLVSVIRVLWSVRATQEYYCQCTVFKTTNNTIIDENYPITNITPEFEALIGGFIYNPDHFPLPKNDQIPLYYWETYEKVKEELGDEVAGIISMFNADIKSFLNDPNKRNSYAHTISWRSIRSTNDPYYHCCLNTKYTTITHPMALFTNLMYGNVLNNKKAFDKSTIFELNNDDQEKKQCEIFENKYNIFLPIYSLDYMYRYIEEFNRICRSLPELNLVQQISAIFGKYSNENGAHTVLSNHVKTYVPNEFYTKIVTDPLNDLFDFIKRSINQNKSNTSTEENQNHDN